MSAIAALKGYRTQFLYSLHYILSNRDKDYKYRLEGEEDLDVLDNQGNLLIAIQVKNLSRPIVPSDLVNSKRTSFLKRYVDRYPNSFPRLVSFGTISSDVRSIKEKVNPRVKKLISESFTNQQWQLINQKIDFLEVNEQDLISEILSILGNYGPIDPVPTAENLLYWLQLSAEKQMVISQNDVFRKIELIATYLSQRIAVKNRYGIYLKALHLSDLSQVDNELLKAEFYNGSNARYEHIQLGLDVYRDKFIKEIDELYKSDNTVVLHGASGQGKSSLAYRYVFESSPASLIYEINIQQDPIETVESIVAIQSIVKSLEVSTIYIINVTPNTTSWLRIVQAFKQNKSIRFLVTIRNEDWYRASVSGIDFSFEKIELRLFKDEAEEIYEVLNKKIGGSKFLNFNELWIKLGEDVPLLELVYSIVQGDSLKNRLRQQIQNIAVDENSNGGFGGQIEFLRILSVIGAFDGHVDVKKIKMYPNIAFIIEKFEREYLLKRDGLNKLITGLHPVRSKLLCELLFDNFIVNKSDYVLPSLQYIYDLDVLPFLVQSFSAQIADPEMVISSIQGQASNSWTYYRSVNSAFLWRGIFDYLKVNRHHLGSLIEKFGDSWYLVADLYHGNTYDIESILTFLGGERQDLLEFVRDTNFNLTPKKEVYRYSSKLFSTISLPKITPKGEQEWRSFGELLFWLSNLPHSHHSDIVVNEDDFEHAFSEISIEGLAKVMLGMYNYSAGFNSIREKFTSIFIGRLRQQFNIPVFTLDDDVSVDILFDFLRDEDSLLSRHQVVVNILDLLRNAFPDKKSFKTQSHGHRLTTISIGFDDSRKEVSISNLPLTEWVNLNATTRRIIEFDLRPEGWPEFIDDLVAWESRISDILKIFEASIRSFKKTRDYTRIVPIADQANYKNIVALKIPKTVSDQLALPTGIRSNENVHEGQVEELSNDVYKDFLTAHWEFKSSIENFIVQSGSVLYDILQWKMNPNHEVDANLKRLSIVNLYSACEKNAEYLNQRAKYFGHLLGNKGKPLDTGFLNLVATMWRSVVGAIESESSDRIATTEGITALFEDFEVRLRKAFNSVAKSSGVGFRYLRTSNNDGAIFIINADTSLGYLLAFQQYYSALHNIVTGIEYQSLKYLMLQGKFSHFFFLPLVRGYSLDNQWNAFPLYVMKDIEPEKLQFHNVLQTAIDEEVIVKLKVRSWEEVHPKFVKLRELRTEFSSVLFLLDHLGDLKFFDEKELDNEGLIMFSAHLQGIGAKIQKSFQSVVDFLTEVLNMYTIDKELFLNSEFEQKYWELTFEIHEKIYPTKDGNLGNFEVTLDLGMLAEWFAKLHSLVPNWAIFTSLLHAKHVESVNINI
jgi:hypothetical protein